ncbi:MAG: amidohydrolase [Bacteroidales bacterium]|nr:amidohydrolase [Bacteroidales bacterium]
MKIINTHAHVIETGKAFAQEGNDYLKYIRGITAFEQADKVLDMLSAENLLRQMDEAGIEQSVVFAMYAPLLFASNEFVAELCQKYHGRFTGFASVDIKAPDAAGMLEHAVKNLGLKGLKLHPPLQNFFPNDRKLWPLYQKAHDLNIPVVFHVGTTPFGSLVKLSQANPILIDDVANDFPGLKIILTHLGTLWHNESFMVVEKHPNLYIDTAAYPYEISDLLTLNLVKRVGEDKFIFGTDFPMPYEGKMHRLADFTEIFGRLQIPDYLKEKIFSGNFLKMMHG